MTTQVVREHDDNVSHYEQRYRDGYGLVYPDGHVIRFHRHILEYELSMTGGRVLDYGCGTGSHLRYFEDNGYTPYGCDISETAIEKCKRLLPRHMQNFHVIPPVPRLRDNFTETFDLIFANQVLYFLNDEGIRNLVAQFHEIAADGAVFFATMMAPTNYFYRNVTTTLDNGLSEVVLKGRLNQKAYVNFKTRDEVLDVFSPFQKLHLGSYSHTIREDEGPTDHFIYVGRKS